MHQTNRTPSISCGLTVALATALLTPTLASAAEHVVVQSNVSWIPADITVLPGDTVRWVFELGFHTVTSGSDCLADGVHFDAILSAKSPQFVWKVPATAAGTTIPYFCAPHCIFGMLGTITVATPPVVHVVTQVEFTFEPAAITVAPGDIIRWVRTGANHTVTSGELCTGDGLYFDGTLTLANPQFEWVVPKTAAGATIPYFCLQHCIFGMTGSVSVTGAPPNPADLNGDGAVSGPDLAILLNAWGLLGSSADIDGDGAVSATDLSILLSSWTG